MNVYDFDETIYNGDSGVHILIFFLLRKPFLVIKHIIISIPLFIKYKQKKIPFKTVKESMFGFFSKINNLDSYINTFINKKECNIKKWYKENQKKNDLIISASLDVWIKPFCKKLGIKNVICTDFDIKKGKIIGNNCKGQEKVVRFNKEYKKIKVNNTYSDSYSDIPMLMLAENKMYLVKNNDLIECTKEELKHHKK